MRITFGTKYNQMNYHQNTLQDKLNETNNKIASGLKIKHGYQDSSVYNQDLKLGYLSNTLSQGIDVAKSAHTKTLNADKTLSEMSKALVQFKTKMIQAANNVHSETSREAIALDLKAIKNHIINMANTSIGGEYIFGGSKVDRPPFDQNGRYYGNDETLYALVGSDNTVPYNITGKQLFFSTDSDKHRVITSNVKMFNQTKLHPDVMDPINKSEIPKEVYIKATDSLRDLVGDDDDDPSNDGKEYFYVRGVGTNGKAFKTKFSLGKSYVNPENPTTVQDLLTKIGEAYGNTSQSRVVDVSLNDWGQIEIRDLKAGNSTIEFHMVSSDKDVDDITDLYAEDARITIYNKSPFMTQKGLSEIETQPDTFQPWRMDLPTQLITKNNLMADRQTALSDIFDSSVRYLKIRIVDDPKNEESEWRIDIRGKNINDLAELMKARYGENLGVELINGKLSFIDKEAQEERAVSDFSFSFTTLDKEGTEIEGIPTNYGVEYDRTYFTNEGSKLIGNVSQVLPDLKGFAKENTKLSEVANGDLNNQIYNLELADTNGVRVDAHIFLGSKGSYLILPNKNPNEAPYEIPLYNPHDEPPAVSVTTANNVTYRQLMDAMGIALSYSNQNSQTLELASQKNISQESKEAYENLLERANGVVELSFDNQSRVLVQDKTTSRTAMKVLFANQSSNDFSAEGIKNAIGGITLNANNALTIDDPHIDFFKQMDAMIEAVQKNIYRPDSIEGYSPDMRNIGIQNGITVLDHLSDHIEKMIVLNGSHSRILDDIVQRNEILKTQIESQKAENIGVDIAETYNKFSNLNTNYNAVLSSTSKINQMSLVNYL
ncbi:flagellar hook-associated protein FlgL [Helicobacter mustelae]|uniref:Flagellar hook-associated protein 3 n=1 Tax=Helicobacter mustelae (strain ATCC 43772 / CCUG 25715 / CIP 103759 / LMG 18044 / NCTC 12198 / R85-136P) TaxID=679897 RepID=D3UHH3_HELM1|nr:flagellar hook-associated protein FlgL [Helicobacter mustelae]CBG39945.1 flagellar hook-associated protein 3 [Helicobacter mustelae 12198]SQH71456.1 flagellar hook-associated protein 3 [Helicobacter mustelae]